MRCIARTLLPTLAAITVIAPMSATGTAGAAPVDRHRGVADRLDRLVAAHEGSAWAALSEPADSQTPAADPRVEPEAPGTGVGAVPFTRTDLALAAGGSALLFTAGAAMALWTRSRRTQVRARRPRRLHLTRGRRLRTGRADRSRLYV
jgi:hypothetical protein